MRLKSLCFLTLTVLMVSGSAWALPSFDDEASSGDFTTLTLSGTVIADGPGTGRTSFFFQYGTTSAPCEQLNGGKYYPLINATSTKISTTATLAWPQGVREMYWCLRAESLGTLGGEAAGKVQRALRPPSYEKLFAYARTAYWSLYPQLGSPQTTSYLGAQWVFGVDASTGNYLGVCTSRFGCPKDPGGDATGRGVYVMGNIGVANGAPDVATPQYVGEVDQYPIW